MGLDLSVSVLEGVDLSFIWYSVILALFASIRHRAFLELVRIMLAYVRWFLHWFLSALESRIISKSKIYTQGS